MAMLMKQRRERAVPEHTTETIATMVKQRNASANEVDTSASSSNMKVGIEHEVRSSTEAPYVKALPEGCVLPLEKLGAKVRIGLTVIDFVTAFRAVSIAVKLPQTVRNSEICET